MATPVVSGWPEGKEDKMTAILTQRPVSVDRYGTEHRFTCSMPGVTQEHGRNRGFAIHRCTECGATRFGMGA